MNTAVSFASAFQILGLLFALLICAATIMMMWRRANAPIVDGAPHANWMQSERPFWWPDSRGFLLASMVIICGVSMFYRMTHPSEVNDKILDMMITIAFSTCLVLIYNWSFGSSSDTGKQQDTQNKIVEKLTGQPPTAGPVAPLPQPAVVVAWWSLLTDAEKAAITEAAKTDAKIQALIAIFAAGKAEPEHLAALVTAGLLTKERADTFKTA